MTIWNIKRTIQHRKRSSHQNDKNRRKTQLDALAYNLIQLYNMTQEIKNSKEDLENFCERESVIHQLKLDVTIF